MEIKGLQNYAQEIKKIHFLNSEYRFKASPYVKKTVQSQNLASDSTNQSTAF